MLRHHRLPSHTAETAACIAGEVRALVFSGVHERVREFLLATLAADAFLVVSRKWSRTATALTRLSFSQVPHVLPHNLANEAIEALNPVTSLVFDNDTELITALTTSRWAANIQADLEANVDWIEAAQPNCTWPPTSECLDGERPDIESFWGHLMLAIRWRACFLQLSAAEKHRGKLYTWVLRTRPDFYTTCRVYPPAYLRMLNKPEWKGGRPVGSDKWVIYWWDHAAFMPRAAANT
mmetsp:Transcript_24098/g.54839  ORF Transcript_24098/g.54839 Transcript_24098/m.54839 type:complete len:237 (-) Transcript_24098:577-1287(-)